MSPDFQIIYDNIGSNDKNILMVDTKRHGILYEDIGETQAEVIRFLEKLQVDAGTTPG